MLRLFALLLCLIAAPLAAQERVALVIGNSAYLNAKQLPNAGNDAADIAGMLRQHGFRVFDGLDLGRLDTLRLIDEFNRALGPDDTALFYFAGHGLQIGAENWLMPVDAEQGDELAITSSSIRLQTVLRGMELRAGNRIVILDACRNNPFLVAGASRSADGGATRGLSRVEAGVGSYIAFSTQPGNVALDGRGRNSPFTEALLRHLATPEQDIHAVMRAVRADVVNASGGTQVPWENSSLIDPLFLVPTAAETDGRKGVRLKPRAMPDTSAMASVTATTPAPRAAPAPAFDHAVQGLNPQDDGFLALRSAPDTKSTILLKLLEGTKLRILDQDGPWHMVELENGQRGWALGNWIRQSAPVPATSGITQPPAAIGIGAPPPLPAGRMRRADEICSSLGSGITLCASSVLPDSKSITYGTANLFDGQFETAWIENHPDVGEGEYLAFDLDAPTTFRELQIVNGYAKSSSLHAKNGRIKILTVTGSNGKSQDLRLVDHGSLQTFALTGFDAVTWLTLTITSAKRGRKWADTAISELRLR
ncbi:caspase family protein [Oceanicola sp. 22II-s10i]|uniref:NADase-type glycan-binding domain-containing protein n=1 Tax=Oceanicola sp. 22II-s10i TaxID=1317116 RepID=UPI001595A310|nr:caspase family protein [Oceanicola sp. 22II-s10i]